MPDYRRLRVPGGTYFFTVNLQNRSDDLLVRHVDELRAAWRAVRQQHMFHELAWVILPNHLHCIWRLPEGDSDFALRWRLIKTRFTKSLPRTFNEPPERRKGERLVWQRRYWEHLVRDDDDLTRLTDYIHWNPVKHGLVKDVDDWPHSSWHDYKGQLGKDFGVGAQKIDSDIVGE